jgi:uncharacterized membrane protein
MFIYDIPHKFTTLSDDAEKGRRTEASMRIYINGAVLFMLGLSMFFTVSLFLAPATMEPGTVEHIDGTSTLDHSEDWEKLPPYQRAIYWFGDSQCHQLEHRSYYLNGNQMPLCSRCMALFMWANAGLVIAMLIRPEYEISLGGTKIFPERFRKWMYQKDKVMVVWTLLAFLCILPTGFDGFLQLLTPYESTNFLRVVLSIPTGWFGGYAIGLMLNTVHYNFLAKPEEEDPEMEELEEWKRRKYEQRFGPPIEYEEVEGSEGRTGEGSEDREKAEGKEEAKKKAEEDPELIPEDKEKKEEEE